MSNNQNGTVAAIITILIIVMVVVIVDIYSKSIETYRMEVHHLKIENADMKLRILELQSEQQETIIQYERCKNFIARHQITRDY